MLMSSTIDIHYSPSLAAWPCCPVNEGFSVAGIPILCRPALTECTLIGFDWKGSRQKLHVLREEGADCLSGAVMVTQLRKVPLPKPAWSPKVLHSILAWVCCARPARHLCMSALQGLPAAFAT